MAPGLYDITALVPLVSQGYTLLTPNHRLARHIKAQWDARQIALGARVWEPIGVQPLESWLFGQWELAVTLGLLPPVTPLSYAQGLELWRRVIVEQERRFPEFSMLQPAAAAELASVAHDTLRRWQVDMHQPHMRQAFQFDRDCASFLTWMTLFEARLAASGQCTLTDCLAQLPALAGRLDRTRVALVECEEVAPLLHAGLAALGQERVEIKLNRGPGVRVLHAFSDHRAELQAVAAWATSLHRVDPTTTIGIVPGDTADKVALEYLLRREFNCLGNDYNSLPVNFSSGISLAHAPLVRDALAALAMSQLHTTVPAVVSLLRSRFLDLPDANSALAQRFVRNLYADGRRELAVSDVRQAAIQITLGEHRGLQLGKRLRDLQAMKALRRRALPSEWAQHFGAILSLWGWPGSSALDSLEFQQLDLWYRTLDELRAYDAVCGVLDFSEAFRLLRTCCSRQISQPQTEDSAVQVLGPLEAAGMTFDHLWLCGMQGSSWPAAPRPSPLIPIGLQGQLHMPHASAEREWEFGEALLTQYTRTCLAVHASYSRQIDGVADLPSPLLRDFGAQFIAEPPPVASQWIETFNQRILEELPDDQGPRLPDEQLTSLQGGSSVVEDQSRCPFRAFARHRLLVEPLGNFRAALSPADRGALLHGALFALWGEIGDSATLHALSPVQRQQTVARAAQAALAGVPAGQRNSLGPIYWQLEVQRLAAVLQEWLLVELDRSPFSVAQREQGIVLELAQLRVNLRVDRVDLLPDGSRVVIDYKSGDCTVQDWLGDRPARPQLLLYGIAEPDTAAALAFARVRPRDCRYLGLGRVAAAKGISTEISRVVNLRMIAPDWSMLNTHWRQTLERIATAFVSGHAPVDPLTAATCTHCGLQPLCRVNGRVNGRVNDHVNVQAPLAEVPAE